MLHQEISMIKHALVTGGAGFIGSAIVRNLLDRQITVTVLDNLSTGFAVNLQGLENVKLLEGDVRDPAAVIHAIAGADVVFHLAASVGNQRSLDNPVQDAEINVLGTLNVLESSRAAGVRRLVYSSSAGIFGELKTLPIAEDHTLNPETPYAVSKLAGERLCLAYTRLYGLGAACLRYFNVYGPRQRFDAYGNVIPKFVFMALAGKTLEIYGDGEQTRDFVHVHDVAEANVRVVLVENAVGVFNIGSGSRITVNRLVELMRVNGLDFETVNGSPRSGDVRDSLADITRAQQAFAFKPTVSFEDGLREYIAWAKQEQE
jgi:UDP-glucose 4-epimerase